MRPATPRTARARSAAMLSALALGALLALPGTAAAQTRSCADFTAQEDAQAVYDQDRSDPDNLDSDGDGVACETLPRRAESTGSTDTASTASGSPVTSDTGLRALAVTTRPVPAATPDAAAFVAGGTTTGTTTTGTTTTGTTTTGTTTTGTGTTT